MHTATSICFHLHITTGLCGIHNPRSPSSICSSIIAHHVKTSIGAAALRGLELRLCLRSSYTAG